MSNKTSDFADPSRTKNIVVMRRAELAKLKVKDYSQTRRGVAHLRVQGKGGKMRFVPTHPGTLTLIEEYPGGRGARAGSGCAAVSAGEEQCAWAHPDRLRRTPSILKWC